MGHSHNGHGSNEKELPNATHNHMMNLTNTPLSGPSQSQNKTHCVIPFMQSINQARLAYHGYL